MQRHWSKSKKGSHRLFKIGHLERILIFFHLPLQEFRKVAKVVQAPGTEAANAAAQGAAASQEE